MREVQCSDIREVVESVEDGKGWHHHYLTPGCVFNDRDMHVVALEVEGDKVVYCSFDDRPGDLLGLLEEKFFDE